MIRVAAYILLLLICLGCTRDFEAPAPSEGDFMRPTCNIGQLKSLIDTARALPIIIGEPIVVQGIVTTSDSAGNIYKSLYIQQENQAMEIKMNVYDLYRVFPKGATVSVNLQGVALDTMGGMITLGPINTWPIISGHLKRQPFTQTFIPERVELENIDNEMIGQTVELRNVEFIKSDTTYSGNQKIRASKGGKAILTLYTSPYCTFAQEQLPQGSLDMTVLIGIYNKKLQLRVSSLDCVHPARDIIFEPDFD